MAMLRKVKRPFHKFIISFDDPVFKFEYPELYLKDGDYRKRFYSEYKVCLAYMKGKKRLLMNEKFLFAKQHQFQMLSNIAPNFKIGDKSFSKKTIIFDLDYTLIKSSNKKHMLPDTDSHIYITFLGNKKIKIYLSIRQFTKEMLEQLREDYELILFSCHSKEYTQKVAKILTLSTEYPCVFH
mmetsp:Transcript_27309/g.26349  ORF Transcript_27309/g.26349 Transcript_27309/m.26349 type:complete len:182 (+) Transcript_27309:238-783(+)